MSFSFFKNKPSLSFIFDIRDTSISIAVARFERDKMPEMVICQNFDLKYQDSQNHKVYLSSMLKTLDTASLSIRKKLVKMGNTEKIGKHYFFIGSPWSVSQSKTIKIIKDKPFEINNNILKKIIVGEELAVEKLLEEETLEPNWKVLEEKIIQSKLNGYKIDDIFGKRASSLAIELLVSFIPSEIENKLSSYINEKVGKHIERQSNSSIMSSYTLLRDLYFDKNDFIYVDLGKLVTDVYVVRDDIIFGIASIPFGEENIIQASLAKTNLSRDIFLSNINIGYDNKSNLSSHSNIEDLLKSGFDLWESKLKSSLSKICTEMNIPNNMFFIKNSVVSSILIKKLSDKANNAQFEILGTKMEISLIFESVLNSLVLNASTFLNEPYIKMDLVFLDKILKGKQ
jgi:hypothetical protein